MSFEQILKDPNMFFFVLAWSTAWKGWALWRAARNSQRNWFIVILILNTLGLVEIVYLLFLQKEGKLWPKIVKKTRVKVEDNK